MVIVLKGTGASYEAENVARLFFPGAQKVEALTEPEQDFVMAVCSRSSLLVMLRRGGTTRWQAEPFDGWSADKKEAEYAVCRLLYDFLRRETGIRPPWGMLTGVRPVRILHDLRAAGADEDAIRDHFCGYFDCSEQRFERAKQIADIQRPVLEGAKPMDYSLYAGIPFCPSRCSYCSFVSRTVGDKATQALVQPYVDKLCEELESLSAAAARSRLNLRTVYIGGGTPTSLSAEQLRQLMGTIRREYDLSKAEEYTVEAGRPDCTDLEKLQVLKEYGATRISINPQTFSDEVLQNIGRKHTAQDILECFRQARQAGHQNINMDLIAGLPGDTVAGFRRSLETAIDLGPENITVHTLTLKRASNLVVEHRADDYDNVAAMLEECELLAKAGYEPYYLYRQKGTLQNLENIGWAKPGFEGLYNIYIMEEVHTILSAGAGGSTKLVQPGRRHTNIERVFNYKYPTEYIRGFDTVLERKRRIEEFYGSYIDPQTSDEH